MGLDLAVVLALIVVLAMLWAMGEAAIKSPPPKTTKDAVLSGAAIGLTFSAAGVCLAILIRGAKALWNS